MTETANAFFDDLIKNASDGLRVARIGKIIKFYPESQTADVLPLPSKDSSIILKVPISTIKCRDFLIYQPLREGDLVVLTFTDNDTENIKLGGDSSQTERSHDITDAIILGSITPVNESLSIVDTNSLCIQNKAGNGSIVIKEDGDIIIQGKNIKLIGERIDLN